MTLRNLSKTLQSAGLLKPTQAFFVTLSEFTYSIVCHMFCTFQPPVIQFCLKIAISDCYRQGFYA